MPAQNKSVNKPQSCRPHPYLTVGSGRLYGGADTDPIMDGTDIVVRLQDSAVRREDYTYPWSGHPDSTRVIIDLPIPDRGVPKNPRDYHALIDYLHEGLMNGLVVQVGCFGGHGRTGMVLASIMAQAYEGNPIKFVREHYCKKAVESEEQVKFLSDYYGCPKEPPSKEPLDSKLWSAYADYK